MIRGMFCKIIINQLLISFNAIVCGKDFPIFI